MADEFSHVWSLLMCCAKFRFYPVGNNQRGLVMRMGLWGLLCFMRHMCDTTGRIIKEERSRGGKETDYPTYKDNVIQQRINDELLSQQRVKAGFKRITHNT